MISFTNTVACPQAYFGTGGLFGNAADHWFATFPIGAQGERQFDAALLPQQLRIAPLAYTAPLADTSALSEAVAEVYQVGSGAYTAALADGTDITDGIYGPGVAVVHAPLLADALATSESLATLRTALATIADAQTLTESLAGIVSSAASLGGAHALAELLAHQEQAAAALIDEGACDAILTALVTFATSLDDGAVTSEDFAGGGWQDLALADATSVTETVAAALLAFAGLAETSALSDAVGELADLAARMLAIGSADVMVQGYTADVAVQSLTCDGHAPLQWPRPAVATTATYRPSTDTPSTCQDLTPYAEVELVAPYAEAEEVLS